MCIFFSHFPSSFFVLEGSVLVFHWGPFGLLYGLLYFTISLFTFTDSFSSFIVFIDLFEICMIIEKEENQAKKIPLNLENLVQPWKTIEDWEQSLNSAWYQLFPSAVSTTVC